MVITQRTNAEDFKKIIKDSPVHCTWTVDDIQRIMIPLLKRQQVLFAYDNDQLQGLVTWAWVEPETAEGYINGTQKLSLEALTGSTGDLWAIDFIAPYGNVKDVLKAFTKRFKELHPEHSQAKMFRRMKGYVSKVTIRQTIYRHC